MKRVAWIAAVVFGALAVFHIVLALGTPWGAAAWGGAREVLPARLRVASAGAAICCAVAAIAVLGRARVVARGQPARLFAIATWALVALMAVFTFANVSSASAAERWMAPVSLVLAALCYVVARYGKPDAMPIQSAFTHSVALSLDPKAMQEPDLEIRWEIEKRLHAVDPPLLFADDGYGFARDSEAMLLAYATSEADRLAAELIRLITSADVLGNRLEAAAIVAVAHRGEDFAGHRIVYPPARAGSMLPD